MHVCILIYLTRLNCKIWYLIEYNLYLFKFTDHPSLTIYLVIPCEICYIIFSNSEICLFLKQLNIMGHKTWYSCNNINFEVKINILIYFNLMTFSNYIKAGLQCQMRLDNYCFILRRWKSTFAISQKHCLNVFFSNSTKKTINN